MKTDSQIMPASGRLRSVPASPIRKLVSLANDAKKQGVRVYHLNIGDPDIKSPVQMMKALRSYTVDPVSYDESQGNEKLRLALSAYYRSLGYGFVTPSRIQVTTGGSEAISMAMFAVADPGDEIIVFEPFYANYNSFAAVNGIRLVPVATSLKDGFHLPQNASIERKLTKRTKAILLCTPNNPTGTVYGKEEMDRVMALARKRNLYVLSDEVYREFVYDNRKHVSILSYLERYPTNTILLDSLSKRYSVCGLRVGSLITLNEEILSGVLRIAQGRLSSGRIDQAVAEASRKVPASYIRRVTKEYELRRDLLYRGLGSMPGVEVPKPEGAFYVTASLPVDDAERYCSWMLSTFRHKNETVMMAPAGGFYATPGSGIREVRIAYVLNRKDLARAVAIIDASLSVYPGSSIRRGKQ